MARRRFVAPARGSIDPRVFEAPIFAACHAHPAWLHGARWPAVTELDAALGAPLHAYGDVTLHFVEQDAQLLADGLHYEARIHRHGAIATRPANWHDLLNALVWLRWPQLKAALNLRQVLDLERHGPAQRSRAQCALTHFDEGGVIVVLRDHALLPLWDGHHWQRLFVDAGDAWRDGRIEWHVFGHALLEHALAPGLLPTAKCLVVLDAGERPNPCRNALETAVAGAIARGELLCDPQELRPLPLAGIPGWHPAGGGVEFDAQAPCFRPLRPGRSYPAAWMLAV
jgi:hypothetical protein